MKRLLCLLVLIVCPAARADLSSDINAVLAHRLLKKAAVGVEIIRLGSKPSDDVTVFRKDARVPLIPASNMKLLTTAAALQKLPGDFKFRTALLAGETDLALVGSGDPTFGDAGFLKNLGWTATTVFESWADQLAKRKITRVRDVVVDDSIFDEVFLHPNWPRDQIERRYEAEVGGFNLNANVLELIVRPSSAGKLATFSTNPPDTRYANVRNTCVTGTRNAVGVGREIGTNNVILRGEVPGRSPVTVAVTIHDPPMYAATVFAEVLRRKGIEVTGSIRRDRTLAASRRAGGPDRWRVLAIHETPLNTVLTRANKDSVNLYAESLCKRLGFEATGAPGSWESGTAALGAFLKSLRVGESEFTIDDGSGLSKRNSISAEAMAKVLVHMFHSPHRDAFRTSLAVAGMDGTMQDRFRRSDLRGRVFAKSGYVANVRALSGYLRTVDGQHYAFSILMNRVPETPEIKVLQEKIVQAIDGHAAALADGR